MVLSLVRGPFWAGTDEIDTTSLTRLAASVAGSPDRTVEDMATPTDEPAGSMSAVDPPMLITALPQALAGLQPAPVTVLAPPVHGVPGRMEKAVA